MGRPGIMLYFDILEPIRTLPAEAQGQLLVAMLEYGRDGVEPQFDGILAMAWGFVKPKLDRDKECYELQMKQRKYASFVREMKKSGLPVIPMHTWELLSERERGQLLSGVFEQQQETSGDIMRHRSTSDDIGRHHSTSDDIARHPTTTATTATAVTPTTTATTTTAAAAATTDFDTFAAAAAEKKLEVINGKLGKGVVVLSEFQVDSLLNQLGLELFDYYVDKLASFILRNGAKVKNHYSTILKWWAEDSTV